MLINYVMKLMMNLLANRKILLSIFFLNVVINFAKGQVTFQNGFGNLTYDEAIGYSVIITDDSCYLYAGRVFPAPNLGYELMLTKTNSVGTILWKKLYGCGINEVAYKVKKTSDGNLITAGISGITAGDFHSYILKTNLNGDTIWTRTYWENYDDERLNDVCESPDSGYVFVGNIQSQFNNSGLYIFKTDSSGNLLWAKSYSGAHFGVSIFNSGNGYLIAGASVDSSLNSHILIMKTDFNGDTIWTKTLGGLNYESPKSMYQTSDGGYVLTGTTSSFGFGLQDIFIVKIDSIGNLMWAKVYGSGNQDNSTCIIQTNDDGFLVTGERNQKALMFKTDITGNVLWSRIYSNGLAATTAQAVVQTNDNGYILTGQNDDGIFSMIKTDSLGNSGCFQQAITLASVNGPFLPIVSHLTKNIVNTIDYGSITTPSPGGTFHNYCVSLNIEKNTEDRFDLNLTPNPAEVQVQINSSSRIMSVRIFAISGNELKYIICSSRRCAVALDGLTAGIYFIEVNTEQGIIVKKLIIQ